MKECLYWRGIDEKTVCDKCGGTGKHTYGSTTTWRGGLGGQALTVDVCDVCWGSGDKAHKFTDLRYLTDKLYELEEKIKLLEGKNNG